MYGIQGPFVPRTVRDLESITTPAFVPGGQLEGYRRTYYDTATISNGDVSAAFFTVPRTAPYATNLENPGSGQLPRKTWFSIGSVHFTPLITDVSGADPDVWRDVAALTLSQNARITLIVENKRYGSWPLRELGSIGGLVGQGYSASDATAESQQFAMPGPLKQGAYVGGTIWLTPNSSFGWLVEWESPGVTLSTSIDCGLEMAGSVYRPIA